MNLFASLAKIGQVAVHAATSNGAPAKRSAGPECTPCAAHAYVKQNAAAIAAYAPPKKARKKAR